jgi:hypothetical protein
MASIMGSERVGEDNVIAHIKLSLDDFEALKGSMDKIHLIPEKGASDFSSVYARGRNGNTKYFRIPKELKDGLPMKKKEAEVKDDIPCIRTKSENKILWTFIVNDEKVRLENR